MSAMRNHYSAFCCPTLHSALSVSLSRRPYVALSLRHAPAAASFVSFESFVVRSLSHTPHSELVSTANCPPTTQTTTPSRSRHPTPQDVVYILTHRCHLL